MSRPPGAQPHGRSSAKQGGGPIDARACARARSTVVRTFVLGDLPRVREAEVHDAAAQGEFRFHELEGQPVVEGVLNGQVTLTCQRCMKAVAVSLNEVFGVVLTQREPEQEGDVAGYEPVLAADPTRFDLTWLAEEQILLGLPLVPLHESDDCAQDARVDTTHKSRNMGRAAPITAGGAASEPVVTQRPFQDLRDLLRKR